MCGGYCSWSVCLQVQCMWSSMLFSSSLVLVIRLTHTSTKTCIKNEWHDYMVNTFIHYPSLSCARVMHFPRLVLFIIVLPQNRRYKCPCIHTHTKHCEKDVTMISVNTSSKHTHTHSHTHTMHRHTSDKISKINVYHIKT